MDGLDDKLIEMIVAMAGCFWLFTQFMTPFVRKNKRQNAR